MSTNNFYVYMLIDPRNNLPFYIGKGTKNRLNIHLKLYKTDTHNKMKTNKIKKLFKLNLKPKVIKYKENLNETEALSLESELIKKYGRICDNSGILTNVIENQMCLYGKNNPNYGKKWNSYQKQIAKERQLANPTFKGKHHTEAQKKFISSIQKKHSFYSIDPITFEVKIWDSLKDFCRFFNLKHHAKILDSLHNPSRTVKSLFLRELTYDNIINNQLIDKTKFLKEIQNKHNKQTVQKDLNNIIIKIWDSRKEICDAYNIDPSHLSKYIKLKKPIKGFLWESK